MEKETKTKTRQNFPPSNIKNKRNVFVSFSVCQDNKMKINKMFFFLILILKQQQQQINVMLANQQRIAW